MKVTAIKQQARDAGRFSVFVDNKYAFSLSESALLESKLAGGQLLDEEGVAKYKQLSSDDKLYSQTLRLVATRPKTYGEVKDYLYRKKALPALTDYILNKLSNIKLIDDQKYATDYVASRINHRPASRRKIRFDLLKKHVDKQVIEQAINSQLSSDSTALAEVIRQKRRQSKYKDNLKLMQYLSRQGFNYEDIKSALNVDID
jgi:regulatory protein